MHTIPFAHGPFQTQEIDMKLNAWAAQTIVQCKNCNVSMSFTGGDGTDVEQWKVSHYEKCQKTQSDLKSLLRGSELESTVQGVISIPPEQVVTYQYRRDSLVCI